MVLGTVDRMLTRAAEKLFENLGTKIFAPDAPMMTATNACTKVSRMF
jgi:hypothetical protein